ncbi:hypothetical protein Hypma_002555 [Hypsizygus marmoreus]|uniref:Uncharacterized protein n=1 Tax=Hypsizygus marmoreus TaxID=39966 RepID=A0A369JCX3_HYPMA|nr:hypothetical protein Hypma_002555 [Hypsizygus marmoreus]
MFSNIFVCLLAAATVVGARAPPAPASALTPSLTPFHTITTTNVTEVGVALTDPTMIFCSQPNCSGDCYRFSLLDRPLAQCQGVIPNPFSSTGIANPDGGPLQFAVGVSFTGSACARGVVLLPKANICYNLSPTGNGWARVSGGTPSA